MAILNMWSPNSCGPTLVCNLTGKSKEEVLGAWPSEFKGDDDDSHLHHRAALKKLGFDMIKVDPLVIIGGVYLEDAVGCLLHDPKNPFSKHWVLLRKTLITATGKILVFFHQGDGTIRNYPSNEFLEVIKNFPECIYKVVPLTPTSDPKKLRWYQKLWIQITKWF